MYYIFIFMVCSFNLVKVAAELRGVGAVDGLKGSRLVCKSDFTNRMCIGVFMRSGRSHGGIRAAWLLKSPSMAILP